MTDTYVYCRECGMTKSQDGYHGEYDSIPRQLWVTLEDFHEAGGRHQRELNELRWQIGVTRDDSYNAGYLKAIDDYRNGRL